MTSSLPPVSFLFPANPAALIHHLASTVFPLLQLGVTVSSPRFHALHMGFRTSEGLVTNAAQVARPMRAYHPLVVYRVDFYHALSPHRHDTLHALRIRNYFSCAAQVQTLFTS